MEFFVEYGYWGLFIAAFLSATILPFSSEVVLVGVLAAGVDPMYCLAAATAGNWFGGITTYWWGYKGDWSVIEQRLNITQEKVLSYKRYSDKYGPWSALLTWLPFIGDIIALALGYFKTSVFWSITNMLIGKFARYWILVFGWESLIA